MTDRLTRAELLDAARKTYDELDEAEATYDRVARAAITARRAYDMEFASQRVLVHEIKGHTEATRAATVALQTSDLKLEADLADVVAASTKVAIDAAIARAGLLGALLESTPEVVIVEASANGSHSPSP